MNWRTGLRKGRSHIIFAVALVVAGLFLIRLDDEELAARHCLKARPCVQLQSPQLQNPQLRGGQP